MRTSDTNRVWLVLYFSYSQLHVYGYFQSNRPVSLWLIPNFKKFGSFSVLILGHLAKCCDLLAIKRGLLAKLWGLLAIRHV